jgi:hypothetical protein
MYGERPHTEGGGSGANRGGPDQERMMQEAERERLAKEAKEVHNEEAAERSESIAKRPWWKFWA